ncbi:hypothetical protein [Anditalea andensis]|nr:hypothetical protein [Anditalea andensis]
MGEDKNYYSSPHRYIGLAVEMHYNLEFFYGQERIALYKRSFKAGHYISEDDHMPSSHQYINEWSPVFFQSLVQRVDRTPKNILAG